MEYYLLSGHIIRSLKRTGVPVALMLLAGPAAADEADLLNAISALQGHVNGTAPLNATQIEANKLVLDANSGIFGDSSSTINASFGLVQAYESQYGAMWSAGSPTENGFSRRDTSDGDIHWAMFHAMQYIVDDTYNSANIGVLLHVNVDQYM